MSLSCKYVELRGFEPLTSCMPYGPGQAPDVAWCRPAWRSAARIMAGRGPASPGDWRRWLPTWLPAGPLTKLVSKANPGDSRTRHLKQSSGDSAATRPGPRRRHASRGRKPDRMAVTLAAHEQEAPG